MTAGPGPVPVVEVAEDLVGVGRSFADVQRKCVIQARSLASTIDMPGSVERRR